LPPGYYLNPYRRRTPGIQLQIIRRRLGDIDDPVRRIGDPVINGYDNLPVIL
jgi:hypothetical protein